jgi:hypothetical protein
MAKINRLGDVQPGDSVLYSEADPTMWFTVRDVERHADGRIRLLDHDGQAVRVGGALSIVTVRSQAESLF